MTTVRTYATGYGKSAHRVEICAECERWLRERKAWPLVNKTRRRKLAERFHLYVITDHEGTCAVCVGRQHELNKAT